MQEKEKTDEKSHFYCVFLIFLVDYYYICAKLIIKKPKVVPRIETTVLYICKRNYKYIADEDTIFA